MIVTITVLVLFSITGIILYKYYGGSNDKNSQSVIVKINYASTEILELTSDEKFSSMLFNDNGAFIVRKAEL